MLQNCSPFSDLDVSNYSKPLPWVGLYVAVANLACTVCIIADIYQSFRWQMLWIGCKYFPINAATLTILGIAMKLPADITTPMPGPIDQMSKLSSMFLVCTSTIHFMPSLGMMKGIDILSNVFALGILVVSVFVNVWIQISTGVISGGYILTRHNKRLHIFTVFNAVASVTMLVIYVIFVSYAVTIKTTMKKLKQQYKLKHTKILQEMPPDANERFSIQNLKRYLDRYWLMALSSTPNYAFRVSVLRLGSMLLYATCILISFATPFVILLYRGLTEPVPHCYVSSDYRWSIGVVFFLQTFAILAGFVSATMRWRSSRLPIKTPIWVFLTKISKKSTQTLNEWRDAPLPHHSRRIRKVLHTMKIKFLHFFLTLHVGVIIMCKLILLISLVADKILCLLPSFLQRFLPCYTTYKNNDDDWSDELDEYVISPDGLQDPHARAIVRGWSKYPQNWIHHGRSKRPANMHSFVKCHYRSENFLATGLFYMVPSIKSWSLCLVTLASIAIATLPEEVVEPIIGSLSEGFRYVTFVEENTGNNKAKKMANAAHMVWDGVELRRQWLHVNCDKLRSKTRTAATMELRDKAYSIMPEGSEEESLFQWLPREIAAKYMHHITEIILSNRIENESWLLGELHGVTACVLGACLTNLPRAIFEHSSGGMLGMREKRVRKASLLLGEVEETLEFLKSMGVGEIKL